MLKLHEWIFWGAQHIPKQSFGRFIGQKGKNGVPKCACAIGAALVWRYNLRAVNNPDDAALMMDDFDKELRVAHGHGLYEEVAHPVTGVVDVLSHVIMELNDDYKWTRERIAAWLKTKGH